MRSLTITFNNKAELAKELTDALADLCGVTATVANTALPKAEKPKADKPAKQEELDLGGKAATDDLDDLLGGGDAKPADTPTEDDMKAELRKVLDKKGKDIVEKVLRKHGAIKVQDVAPEERQKVMDTCKAVLAK
jgi:hypothetical protein